MFLKLILNPLCDFQGPSAPIDRKRNDILHTAWITCITREKGRPSKLNRDNGDALQNLSKFSNLEDDDIFAEELRVYGTNCAYNPLHL